MSWLKEEDALTLLKLYVDGLSFQQIGDRVGKDARVVEKWLARHNAFHITRKNKKEFTKEEMTKIEEINYLRLWLRELRNGDAAERLRLHREIARLVQSIPMPQRRLQELKKLEKDQKSSVPDGLNPILVERLDYIETEVLDGRTDEEIAEGLGISYDEVAKFIGCYRLRPTSPSTVVTPRQCHSYRVGSVQP